MSDDPLADFLSREQDQIADLGDDLGVLNSQEFDLLEGSNEDQLLGSTDEQAATSPGVNLFVEEQQEEEEQQPQSDLYDAVRSADVAAGESTAMQEWREEFKAKLIEKDEAEEKAINEWREAAQSELDTWARNHGEQLDKAKADNREMQEAFVQERDHGVKDGEWERVAQMCDFSSKTSKQTKDVGRMRSILFRLKTEPLIR